MSAQETKVVIAIFWLCAVGAMIGHGIACGDVAAGFENVTIFSSVSILVALVARLLCLA